MFSKRKAVFQSGGTVFAGILFFGLLSGILNPIQNDTVHAVALLNMKGGQAMHPAHFILGEGLFGRFTLLLTATVIPPVQGDLLLEINGPEQLEYNVASRYPPVVPLVNRSHAWFSFTDGIHRGVQPGDSLLLVLRIKPPKEPGEYQIVLKDAQRGQVYLALPASFELPMRIGAGGKVEEPCH
jgi:hypothetical protein